MDAETATSIRNIVVSLEGRALRAELGARMADARELRAEAQIWRDRFPAIFNNPE